MNIGLQPQQAIYSVYSQWLSALVNTTQARRRCYQNGQAPPRYLLSFKLSVSKSKAEKPAV
jgi:hypothetical protein